MMGSGSTLEWIVFWAIIVGVLTLDFAWFNRKAHRPTFREAAAWAAACVGLAIGFNVYVLFQHGPDLAAKFLAAYLIEESLSVDNLFVFLAIFNFFRIPPQFQHRVLFLGIVGAIAMRAVFIFAGTALLHRFDWMMYVFGAFLVYTGARLGLSKKETTDPSQSLVMRLSRRYLRTTPELHGARFFVVKDGVRMATPLFVVLLLIEFTDVLFAFDSVPAALGISTDPFIVYTSNIFAVLGLRALYFLLSSALSRLRFLNAGLSLILVFIGGKMIAADWVHVPTLVSLGVVAGILALAVLASWLVPERKETSP